MTATCSGPLHGFTVFFTGLSGAGKSTLATLVTQRLVERGRQDVTLLDGDAIRKRLSSDLGFTKEHRDLHVRRFGLVAQEITKEGGIAVCAPIAPYDNLRKEVRAMVGEVGGFVLVYVATPLAVCEQRDPKGLYARARAATIPHFTGISDPYEAPQDAEITVDTSIVSAEAAVDAVLQWLENEMYLPREIDAPPAAPDYDVIT